MTGRRVRIACALAATALVLTAIQPVLAATPSATPTPSSAVTPSATPTLSATPNPTASPTPTPTPVANKPRSCSIRAVVNSKDLGQFYGYVMNATTGQVYANIRGDEQTPSASVMKVVTAAAAMTTLEPNYSATTKVYVLTDEPTTVVLRGGGDHTLSRLNSPSFSTYKKPPKLSALAAQLMKVWPANQPITKIILDDTFFDKPTWNSAWKASDRTNGYMSIISALQVDSDRKNPDLTKTNYSGYRSSNPTLSAGNYFKQAIGQLAMTATLEIAATPQTAVEVASATSQPITVWLDHALKYSDNTETEIIARHALKSSGMATTFSNVQPLSARALKSLGVDSKKLTMLDGSGLAQGNRVTARMIATLLAKATKPESKLSPMIGYLPVAGKSGTLATRFNGANAVARGSVYAKSGYIPGLYSLAGIVYAKDGTAISFAGFARSVGAKKVGYAARPALDSLASRLYTCGAGSFY